MPALLSTSRREAESRAFSPVLYLVLPLLAVALESLVALRFPSFLMLDLPLLVVIYFSLARRSPIFGTLSGAIIGILQDALTHLPLGVFGICKSVVGYLAASLGVRIDTENNGARLLLTFGFALLHNALHWLLLRHLLLQPAHWNWIHELLRGAVNAVVGVVLYALLDRTRPRDY